VVVQSLSVLVYRADGFSIAANDLVDSFRCHLHTGYAHDHPGPPTSILFLPVSLPCCQPATTDASDEDYSPNRVEGVFSEVRQEGS